MRATTTPFRYRNVTAGAFDGASGGHRPHGRMLRVRITSRRGDLRQGRVPRQACMTASTFPAGSRNHAMSGPCPLPRTMPRESEGNSSSL
ncbi:MAG: hypothetical protein K0Q52_3728 [Microbacterium sp.]|nr:hypothetical protein [Microbacterium sp.]